MGRMEEARQVYLLASKYEPHSQELNRRFEEIYAETLAPDSDEADDELFPPSETKQKTNGASSSLQISADDLECSLCLKLFYEPVTTPCGHTFCRSCLFRALDYRAGCPLCRSPIHFAPDHAVSVTIQSLIEKYFPKQLQKRRAEMEAERQEAETCMPLFLLNTVAFPGMRFPMHIFEPRYRLMLRRCLQGTKVFGLVNVQQNPTNMRWESSNAGCALKITKHTLLPDGRSFIETIGTKRFKIVQKREQDGYIVGKIEWLEDELLNEQDMARYDHLRERTRSHLTNMLHNLQCYRPLQPLLERMGDVPEDDASLCYWLASYLPIPNAEKQALLEDNSPLQRMEVLHCILAQIRSFVQSAQDEREERAASGASTSNVDDDGLPSQCLLS
ncbi:LON peptidase N-terminal domain and RING finger protein 3, variant 2 [Balamuthia mandrillaris]